MRAASHLILLLALAGCVRRPVAPPPANACPLPPRPVAAAAPSPPRSQSPCERSYAATVARLRELPPVPLEPGESPETVEGRYDTILSAESPFRFCHASPRGTWSVEAESLRRWRPAGSVDTEISHDYAGRWALVFTTPDGRRAVAHPEPDPRGTYNADATNIIVVSGLVGIIPRRFASFDYDGDGIPEVASVIATHQHEAPHYARAQVWTVRDGHAVSYAPAQGIAAVDVEDVDEDGRPDLITHLGYEAESGGRGSGFGYHLVGPRFAAHATAAGAFATDDPAAIAAARRACPPRTGSVIVRVEGGSGVRDVETAQAIVCARLRGAPSEPIVREVRRACAPRRDPPGAEPRAMCDNPEILIEWARRAPPLRLSE